MHNDSEHWQKVYGGKPEEELSWFELNPQISFDLVRRHCLDKSARIIDVGAGTSRLVDLLLTDGYANITLLDISKAALDSTRARLGAKAEKVTFITADILTTEEIGKFELWHDRALFHFLTNETDRSHYAMLAARSIVPGGHLVLLTFAPSGPESCSNLPVCRYSATQLAAIFSNGFALVASDEISHRTPWGDVQPFTVAVLQRAVPV
ncbi:MAG: class I SAM-dependent methyltransferase [Armatimonadetes bacterium]|nr:class I SAM-dependent methyltransferase [Armatimonadota bacterium]